MEMWLITHDLDGLIRQIHLKFWNFIGEFSVGEVSRLSFKIKKYFFQNESY